jgi:DNA segregation ATPase FtsK/SpoIIIE, S-DNA-T family
VNRLGDAHRQSDPVGVNVAKVHVPLPAALFAWMGRRLGAGGVWLARNPGALVVAVLALVACHVTASHGPLPVAAVLVAVGALLCGWARLRRDSFNRWVTWRARGLWRAATMYRYRWQPAMLTTALAGRLKGTGYLPRLVRVRSTGSVDVVRVRMLPGQTATDWADNAPRLAQTFGALDCRVRSVPGRVHDLELWFLTTDPLTAPVQPFTPLDPRTWSRCRSLWGRTAWSTGSGCWARTCSSSARPGPGRAP